LALEVVVADEDQPGFDPQRLDRRETVRHRAGAGQRRPELGRIAGRAEDLVAELARIAGARHPGRNAADANLLRPEAEVAEAAHVRLAQSGEQLARPRALELHVR